MHHLLLLLADDWGSGRWYVGPLRLNNDDLQQPSFWALPPSHPSHSIFHLTTIDKTYLREHIKSMKLNKRRVKTGAWSVLRGAHSHLGYHLALFDPLVRDRHSSFISYNFFSGFLSYLFCDCWTIVEAVDIHSKWFYNGVAVSPYAAASQGGGARWMYR